MEKQDILMDDLLRQGATLREDIIETVNKHMLVRMHYAMPFPLRTDGFRVFPMPMRPTTYMSAAIVNGKHASRVQERLS